MDNDLDNCPDCGAQYSLVGFRHRCIRKAAGEIISVEAAVPLQPVSEPSTTYQYRDPVKRRTQVAEAMRRYRARKK